MDKYTASNGVTVWRDSTTGNLRFGGDAVDLDHLREKLSGESRGMYPAMDAALREFFQAERDEELGRWRWPENPDYVVYAPVDYSNYVRVLDERSAILEVIHREHLKGRGSLVAQAARAYFEAHPERKPWEDAKHGEVWLLTIDGAESAFYPSKSLSRAFTPVAPNTGTTAVPFDWPEITDARRIFPEAS